MPGECSIKNPEIYRISPEKFLHFIYLHQKYTASTFYLPEKKMFYNLTVRLLEEGQAPPEDWLEEIEEPFGKLRKIAILAGRKFTLVPEPYFEAGTEKNILSLNFNMNDNEIVKKDFLPPLQAFILYSVPPVMVSFLEHFQPEATIHAIHPFFLSSVSNIRQAAARSMILHVETEFIYILVFNQKHELLLANSFPYKAAEDILYHVLNVCSRLEINLSTDNFLISGDYYPDTEFYKLIFRYIKYPLTHRLPEAIKFHEVFEKFPFHSFFNLFSTALCV
ncbi:MAG TPA: DUF3822 family protein [Bacteroidia bacterium]|nr:DUF3822 family protein [Bacteroidia bacterium]HRS59209.1 DUF3822 family protein [Bacteroidia bacterium]HRU67257.1 DUF3822 family protein [Bacteroidia bacterium]